ncbi:hypothetical protein BROUX41_003704 [Berkeleyomyces rouxiae]|uniref:uncharacterized protein n=1 Tax=Berkeleyomyces rouxiae TaxID=2035830 RepID=UPI003B7F89A8
MIPGLQSLYNSAAAVRAKLKRLGRSVVPSFETMRPYLRIVLAFTRPKFDNGGFDEEEVRQRVANLLHEIALRPYMDEIHRNKAILRKAARDAAVRAAHRNFRLEKAPWRRQIRPLRPLAAVKSKSVVGATICDELMLSHQEVLEKSVRGYQRRRARRGACLARRVRHKTTAAAIEDPLEDSLSKPKSAFRCKRSYGYDTREVRFGGFEVITIPSREEEGNAECTLKTVYPDSVFPRSLEELDEAMETRTPVEQQPWFHEGYGYVPRDNYEAMRSFQEFSESEPGRPKSAKATPLSGSVVMTELDAWFLSEALPIRLGSWARAASVVALSSPVIAPSSPIVPASSSVVPPSPRMALPPSPMVLVTSPTLLPPSPMALDSSPLAVPSLEMDLDLSPMVLPPSAMAFDFSPVVAPTHSSVSATVETCESSNNAQSTGNVVGPSVTGVSMSEQVACTSEAPAATKTSQEPVHAPREGLRSSTRAAEAARAAKAAAAKIASCRRREGLRSSWRAAKNQIAAKPHGPV